MNTLLALLIDVVGCAEMTIIFHIMTSVQRGEENRIN